MAYIHHPPDTTFPSGRKPGVLDDKTILFLAKLAQMEQDVFKLERKLQKLKKIRLYQYADVPPEMEWRLQQFHSYMIDLARLALRCLDIQTDGESFSLSTYLPPGRKTKNPVK